MKTLALAALLSLAPAAVMAGALDDLSPNTLSSATCAVIGSTAEHLMIARQDGVPMSKAMRVLVDEFEAPKEILALNKEMILAAYQVPMFSTQSNRNEFIAEFRNDYETACYIAAGG